MKNVKKPHIQCGFLVRSWGAQALIKFSFRFAKHIALSFSPTEEKPQENYPPPKAELLVPLPIR